MAVKIPARVYEQLEEVRQSGETNMYDVEGVIRVANDYEYFALAGWLAGQVSYRSYGIRTDPDGPYARGMREGFEPEEESNGD